MRLTRFRWKWPRIIDSEFAKWKSKAIWAIALNSQGYSSSIARNSRGGKLAIPDDYSTSPPSLGFPEREKRTWRRTKCRRLISLKAFLPAVWAFFFLLLLLFSLPPLGLWFSWLESNLFLDIQRESTTRLLFLADHFAQNGHGTLKICVYFLHFLSGNIRIANLLSLFYCTFGSPLMAAFVFILPRNCFWENNPCLVVYWIFCSYWGE